MELERIKYRKIMEDEITNGECKICNSLSFPLLIHHIDGNPMNNDPSNIEFLTRRQHMIKDGRLEQFIKRNEKRTPYEVLEEAEKCEKSHR